MTNATGPFRTTRPLTLGSGSPRRKELLANLGLNFDVQPSLADEPAPEQGENPVSYARRMAEMKTLEVAGRFHDSVCLGADTIVVLGERIMGKPVSDADALEMLAALSGRTHEVITGCCLVTPGEKPITFEASTAVRMRKSTEEELRAYIATGEPVDKAGAYAIQGIGTFLVEHVTGSYTNVVGLPVARVLEVLLSWGVVTTDIYSSPR